MRSILSAFFVLGLATSAHADDGWSSYLDIGASYERGNLYNAAGGLLTKFSGYQRSGSAELQHKWNACAVGARATLESVEITDSYAPSFENSDRSGDEVYGIAGQVGCNMNGLWLVGFGGIQGFEFQGFEANFFRDYFQKDFGAGIYYRSGERFGLGIAVSRLNTSYTYYSSVLGLGKDEFDTDTVTGKLDYFLSSNLLYSTTASYSQAPFTKTGAFSMRLEFKPEAFNVATYAGIGGSFDYNDSVSVSKTISLTAKVGLRWYFSDGTLQAHYNNMMPTFE